MAQRQLRLHLGAHKTATTHLQRVLTRRTAALARLGVDFVPPEALRPVLREARGWRHRLLGRTGARLAAAIEARATGLDVLAISDENLLGDISDVLNPRLYPRLARRLAVLAPLAEGREVHLFLAIRPLDRVWASAYAEALRHHRPRPGRLAALEAAAIADPPSWLDPIARLRDTFPRAAVTVWRYEDYRTHGRAIAGLFLGRDPGWLPDLPPPRWTISPGPAGVRAAEQVTLPMPGNLRRKRIAGLYAAHPAAEEGPFAPFGRDAVLRLQERYSADLEALDRDGLLAHPETIAAPRPRPDRRL